MACAMARVIARRWYYLLRASEIVSDDALNSRMVLSDREAMKPPAFDNMNGRGDQVPLSSTPNAAFLAEKLCPICHHVAARFAACIRAEADFLRTRAGLAHLHSRIMSP